MMIEIEKVNRAIKEIEVKLKGKIKLSNFELLEICKQNGVGSLAGETDSHSAHEALEVAVNNFIAKNYYRKDFQTSYENSRILVELEALENRIPVQSWRSIEQMQLQQFSTPPTITFVMTKILNPLSTDLILEPSSGTGSLATWLRIIGCSVHLNELSERRRAMLELQGYQPTAYNAEFLDDLMPEEIKPDGVLMNPPFTTSGGRAKTGDSNFGFRHVEAALARLKNGGKLVALLGCDALTKTDKGLRFLSQIAAEHNLKAVINLPKDAFYKYGTTLPTSIICVKKKNPREPISAGTPSKNVLKISCRNLEEVLRLTALFD